MGSRSFKLNIIVRVLLILLVIFSISYMFLVSYQFLRGSYFGVLLIFQVIELFRYIDRTNRDISNFFLMIKERDLSTHFKKKGKGGSFDMLYESMNQLTQEFKTLSIENEIQLNFLSMLVEHLKVGILSFDSDEKIHLMNPAIQSLLSKPSVATLDQLTPDVNLLQTLRSIKPGENKLLTIHVNNELIQLAIHASEFRLDGHFYKLISMQNVKNELEVNELEAWQKLIRVLTHEIMNSVAPITSLTDTLIDIVNDTQKNSGVPSQKTIENLSKGLDAIKVRSSGLHTFTEAYQSLTKLPPPKFTDIPSEEFISPLQILFKEELNQKDIKFHLDNQVPDVGFLIDKELMGQVLVNLIKNAIEALDGKDNKRIEVHIYSNLQNHCIDIIDNGNGVQESISEKIFVPFFTTKSGGSGIGLALSRQILHLHNGTLSFKSTDSGTRFMLRF